MGWPDWGGPGTPVTPGDPTSEGINQYGTSGLYGSRGYRQVSQFENPDFPSFYQTPSGAYRSSEPVAVRGVDLYQFGGPVVPFQEPEPREPFVPVLDVNPTPTPSTERAFPPGKGAPSDKTPTGGAKAAKSKERPTSAARGFLVLHHKGRQISWP